MEMEAWDCEETTDSNQPMHDHNDEPLLGAPRMSYNLRGNKRRRPGDDEEDFQDLGTSPQSAWRPSLKGAPLPKKQKL